MAFLLWRPAFPQPFNYGESIRHNLRNLQQVDTNNITMFDAKGAAVAAGSLLWSLKVTNLLVWVSKNELSQIRVEVDRIQNAFTKDAWIGLYRNVAG